MRNADWSGDSLTRSSGSGAAPAGRRARTITTFRTRPGAGSRFGARTGSRSGSWTTGTTASAASTAAATASTAFFKQPDFATIEFGVVKFVKSVVQSTTVGKFHDSALLKNKWISQVICCDLTNFYIVKIVHFFGKKSRQITMVLSFFSEKCCDLTNFVTL